ncbi:MAG TPA: hypothetical protein VJ961_05830 [Mariprofundaceae bacterium]|nr:hypothetical protein [Mariprofundaceae bacterium]
MKYTILFVGMFAGMLCLASPAQAVTQAEDIATTIILRGYACGGRTVSNISESQDAKGNKTIRATCPNGKRYQIHVTADGRVTVRPLN